MFANPGTSEMHFVAALDKVKGMRCVLGLAETVVTGCADGYARMAGKPAATLLHCGPGLANGMANVHNARRANSPMVNIVGDHATYHRPHDTPLTSDIEGMARTVSSWVRTSMSAASVGADAAAAAQAAKTAPGQVATLVLPADSSWNEGGEVGLVLQTPARQSVAPDTVRTIARVLRRGEPTVILLAGQSLTDAGLLAANRIAHATGAVLRTPSPVVHMARGRGRPAVDRVPYNIDNALKMLAGTKHVVLVGANRPPNSSRIREGPAWCSRRIPKSMSSPGRSRTRWAHWKRSPMNSARLKPRRWCKSATSRSFGRGPFNVDGFASTLGAMLPENCIVEEDAVTSGRPLFAHTYNSPPHDWLQISGGAIGHGFPCATGAAVACPDRKVGMSAGRRCRHVHATSFVDQAREKLDVINVVFANRIYKILQGELLAVGAQPGAVSTELFDLARPDLDWVKLAGGMGVEAASVDTLEAFADVFASACKRQGPFLIEFRI